MRKIVLLVLFSLYGVFAWAQQLLQVKGTIRDHADKPLIGATITVQGISTVTKTDQFGNFSIQAEKGKILEVSYLGMATQQIQVRDGSPLQVKLLEGEESELEEVVVIGTRIPFLVCGPGVAQNSVSSALFCQIDLLSSIAQLLREKVPIHALDSEPLAATLLGHDKKGRQFLVEHAGTLAILKDNWKYIEPSNGAAYSKLTDTELGNNPEPQLYDLDKDRGEKINLAKQHPEKVSKLRELLQQIKQSGEKTSLSHSENSKGVVR